MRRNQRFGKNRILRWSGIVCRKEKITVLSMGSCVSTEGSCVNNRWCWSSAKDKSRGRKRSTCQQVSGTATTNGQISGVAGRMCTNGCSSIACMFTQQGRKGTNQDAMVVWEEFTSKRDAVFCGVFDGHGPFGHLVARRVRDTLPAKLSSHWEAVTAGDEGFKSSSKTGGMNSDETASVAMEDEWKGSTDPEAQERGADMLPSAWRESFLKAFRVTDKELRLHPAIDCFWSGTTAVTLVKQGEDLVMGNLGDSRAVLATRDEHHSLVAVQLTVDLKPNLPREAERIKQFKGRVFALQDEPDVARLWLPHDDTPGLAMARAFGDFCLKDFGLIAVPELTYRRLTERDEFIVLATDGVWDVLSNKEVVDIVASAPTRATSARSLVEFAVRAWRLKYPTSKVDDCAVVCLFLHKNPASKRDEPPCHPNLGRVQGTPLPVQHTGCGTTGNLEKKTELEECLVEEEAMNPSLGRSNTVRVACNSAVDGRSECAEIAELKRPERSQSRRSLADCLSTPDDEEWSALEGVTRVNSLLNLPRFMIADKRLKRH